jgi:hypothetical protein
LASALECGGVLLVEIIGGCHRKKTSRFKFTIMSARAHPYTASAQERRGYCKGMDVSHGFDGIHDKSQ